MLTRSWSTLVVFASLLLLASSDVVASEGPLVAAFGGERYVLAREGAASVLALPDGKSLRLAVPAGGVVESLVAVAEGWVAAGSFADDDGRRRLFVLAGAGRSARRVSPPRSDRSLQQGAVLLVDDGRLVAMAWLEGDSARSLGVAASRWNGERFRTPERVAAPGPGSQLALAGAVLADGSPLVAWSAFDGDDDEILWSRRLGSGWLAPAKLTDNEVPDVVPALTALGTGAVVAWSRYDGNDYRLHLARFAGDGFTETRMVGGRGSLFPSFLPERGEAPCLVYRAAEVRGWGALELDGRGQVVRSALAAEAPAERPLASTSVAGEIRFEWPGLGRRLGAAWRAVAAGDSP